MSKLHLINKLLQIILIINPVHRGSKPLNDIKDHFIIEFTYTRISILCHIKICSKCNIGIIINCHTPTIINYLLRDTDFNRSSFSRLTVQRHKSSKSTNKALNNNHRYSKPARPYNSAGFRLIETIIYTIKFLLSHTNSCICNRYTEIYSIFLSYNAEFDIDSALFSIFESIINQMIQYLSELDCITLKNCRYIRINIYNQFKFFRHNRSQLTYKII